jgi:TRAP transporter 4TM/12TM fusion protein
MNGEKKFNLLQVSSILAIVLSLFHIYTSIFGIVQGMLQPVVHITLVLLTTYSLYQEGMPLKNAVNGVCLLLSIFTTGYIIWNHEEIINRMQYVDPVSTVQLVLGILFTILILVHCWRVIGWIMPAIALVFIAYTFIGPYLPGFLYHRGGTVAELVEQLYLTFNGIFGTALIISATVVFMFILFGSFLERSGAGELFMELVKSMAGHFRGGPALMAVSASALMGTISGSAIANVVTTGTFTIPLMKRVGYERNFAGAVEAVASTGGQIMPPVMGAAAFIMAEYIGVSYGKIVIAAAIPALLYFLGVGFQVYLEARRLALPMIPRNELRPFWRTFKDAWHILFSLGAIVYFLLEGFTAMRAGLYGIITILAVVFIRDRKRISLQSILTALASAGKAAIPVASACATAGIIIGVVRLTGLGLKASSAIVGMAGGSLLLALIFTAMTSIVLGMGLPTTASYIIQAAIAAPALVKLGVPPMAAHLFVFYFACLAVITPPVALAAYAAAPIAEGNANTIGWTAFRLGIAAYIVPFMFVYGPPLLMTGGVVSILLAFATAIIGIFSLATAAEGWLGKNLSIIERIFYLVAALLLIKTGFYTDILGFGVLALLIVWGRRSRRGRMKLSP